MESQYRIRKFDAGVAFRELEEAGVRVAKMDGKLDLVDAWKILKECEVEMEDLSLKVRENVMDQEMEVEDVPWGILNMRSAQQKGGTTLAQSRSKLEETRLWTSTTGAAPWWPWSKERKPGSQEAQRELRRAGGTGIAGQARDFNVL